MHLKQEDLGVLDRNEKFFRNIVKPNDCSLPNILENMFNNAGMIEALVECSRASGFGVCFGARGTREDVSRCPAKLP
jgi:hypothetical protein